MTILLAEDNPITREALATVLELEGYRTLLAVDGREAVALWRQHRPQLLCLDIMMPGMDGFEVCRQVRAADQQVPILFLSAKNEEKDVVVGLGLGADDFIRKPFTAPEVVARVRAALRRAPSGQGGGADSFMMGGLRILPAGLMAEREGVSISLTPRELAILTLLHRERGRPVTRDRLLDECWGLDYFPDSRTVDQHILMLRKKVEADPVKPQIVETVRGVGYRYREG